MTDALDAFRTQASNNTPTIEDFVRTVLNAYDLTLDDFDDNDLKYHHDSDNTRITGLNWNGWRRLAEATTSDER